MAKTKTSTKTKVIKKAGPSLIEKLFHDITFKDLLVPIAIIAGALIVGGAVAALTSPYYYDYKAGYAEMHEGAKEKMIKGDTELIVKKKSTNQGVAVENLLPVTAEDHTRGGENAKVSIVEYSDLDCPFCVRLHDTLKTVIDEYDGEVAWTYRHFPLTSLHPNAENIAQASECVAAAGGSEAFWDFVDGYFAEDIQPDLTGVEYVTGVSRVVVESCVAAGTYQAKVAEQFQNAKDTGGKGTPWTVLVGPNGTYKTISGAQPIEKWRTEIDALLNS